MIVALAVGDQGTVLAFIMTITQVVRKLMQVDIVVLPLQVYKLKFLELTILVLFYRHLEDKVAALTRPRLDRDFTFELL